MSLRVPISAALVPSSVTVPANGSSTNFSVKTKTVSATTLGNITATYSGVNKSTTLTVLWPSFSFGQTLPKVRMAYTSINIQMTPIYIMKDLDLPRQHGLDAEILMIPVSSRAIQAALAGEIQFITSGGVANINANMSDGDFVGITSTISTFVFKIIGQPGIKEPSQLKGKKVAISRLGGASDFSLRYALDRWGLVPEKDVAIIQIGGEAEGVLALQNKAVDAATIS